MPPPQPSRPATRGCGATGTENVPSIDGPFAGKWIPSRRDAGPEGFDRPVLIPWRG
jgi:hypothetical protein